MQPLATNSGRHRGSRSRVLGILLVFVRVGPADIGFLPLPWDKTCRTFKVVCKLLPDLFPGIAGMSRLRLWLILPDHFFSPVARDNLVLCIFPVKCLLRWRQPLRQDIVERQTALDDLLDVVRLQLAGAQHHPEALNQNPESILTTLLALDSL